LKEKKKSTMPKHLSPMLPSTSTKAFNDPEWLYEVKWDGYRTLAYLNNGKVELHAEKKRSLDQKFYPVYEALKQWSINAVVDGEIVALNEEGISSLEQLEKWKSPDDGELVYYVFDLIWLNGYDFRHLPVEQRRNMLRHLVLEESAIHFSESFAARGTEFFASARTLGIGGIVAKKATSPYEEGTKTKNWVVIPTKHR